MALVISLKDFGIVCTVNALRGGIRGNPPRALLFLVNGRLVSVFVVYEE